MWLPTCGLGLVTSTLFSIANTKAAVLPDPLCARAIMLALLKKKKNREMMQSNYQIVARNTLLWHAGKTLREQCF